jgi:hypothetical protein
LALFDLKHFIVNLCKIHLNLKLPLLLTQYLYEYKKLNLPGIGSFVLDPATIIPEEPEKTPHETIKGLEFSYILVEKPDSELIDFIRLHTGKMKPLAEADLESDLTLGIQLLNIGKPFYLDGIGAIVKTQDAKYEFTPGEYVSTKKNDPEAEKKEKHDKRKSVFEEQHDNYEPQTNSLRKVLVVLGVIGGLVLIGWGGYTLYKKNTYPENTNPTVPTVRDTTTIKTDTSSVTEAAPVKTDSVQQKKVVTPATVKVSKDSTLYKFVILATNKKYKALKRYEQLLGYQLKIKMETKDSSFFKLYFAFPAFPKDTIRIKDSLNLVYATKVFIER